MYINIRQSCIDCDRFGTQSKPLYSPVSREFDGAQIKQIIVVSLDYILKYFLHISVFCFTMHRKSM